MSGELDRRALLDAQQYLQQMMKQGQGEQGENYARSRSSQGDEDATADGVKEKNPSNLPGKEPGKKSDETPVAAGFPRRYVDAREGRAWRRARAAR